MQSTPNLRDTDPHDVFVIEPDVSLAARADKAPLDLLYDVLSHPSDPAPSPVRPDPELRIAPDFSAGTSVPPVATVRTPATEEIPTADIQLGETEISAHRPTTSKFARGAVMSLFALVSATGAAAWQHYGDDARAMVARYAPPFALMSPASAERPATSEQPATGANQAAAEPAPPADNAAPVAVATAPDQTQVIQSMARDLAAMGQQISELKAIVEQLKASQPQTASAGPSAASPATRAAEARLTEPVAPLVRPKIVPPPAHSTVATLARRPKQVFPYAPIAPAPPPQQAAAAAPAPMQIAPQAEDGGPVVRPPMPLH